MTHIWNSKRYFCERIGRIGAHWLGRGDCYKNPLIKFIYNEDDSISRKYLMKNDFLANPQVFIFHFNLGEFYSLIDRE